MTQPAKPTIKAQEGPTQFEMLTGEIEPRMTMLVHGRTKHGKTELALKSPGDAGVISLDSNCKAIAAKYKLANPKKQIFYKEFLRSPLSQIDDINELKKHWQNVRKAYYDMLDIKTVRTVICDTHTQMWEDCKLAYVGKEKPDASSEVDAQGKPTGKQFGTQKTIPRDLGEAKRDMRGMINACEAAGKNLVLLCKADDEWKDDPQGKGFKTGKVRRIGMPGIEYLSQCEVEVFRHETLGTFVARMLSSTANADIRGRQGSMVFVPGKGDIWQPSQDEFIDSDITFGMIAISVYPSTEIEAWE